MNINRRHFLRSSALTAAGLGLTAPLLGTSVFASTRPTTRRQAPGGNDKVLVIVNLFGGNDRSGRSTGLAAIAPRIRLCASR